MKKLIQIALAVATLAVAAQASAQVTFYEHENFEGRSFSTQQRINNFQRFGFNDRASSVIVQRDRWEVCEDNRFDGRCVVLRRGRYPSLAAMGLNDRVSSARVVTTSQQVDDNRYAPQPPNIYDARRRQGERLYQADVTAVRAVVGTPAQRCWVEREQVQQDRSSANVPAALAGAVVGGILGHQVGGGSGKDIATAVGAVAGGALGANYGRNNNTPNNQQMATRDIQRCTDTPGGARPDYWDVTYQFRGQEHRIQMVTPPGQTITVNRLGEPRA